MKIKLLFSLILSLCLSGIGRSQAQTQPVISSFSPLAAAPGTSVTLSGLNFNATAGNNVVYFGAVKTIVTAATTNSLTVNVPINASYGAISVLNTTTGLIATSREYFIPLPNRSRPTALVAADFVDQGSTAATPSALYHLASSDLDNDGKPDLVVTSPVGNTIFIHRNTSTASAISFAGAISHATGSVSINMVPAIGDLNGDGRPDIVVTGLDSGNFTVLQNTGDLSAFTTSTVSTGAEPAAAGIGDFDSDGKMDVVIGHDSGTDIVVYRNDGTPGGAISFGSPVSASGFAADKIVVADLNRDGKPDILIGKGSGVTLLENTTISGVISFSETPLASPVVHSLTIGDLDNDGKLDLITTFPNTGGTDLTVFRNTSAGAISFSSQTVSAGDPQLDVSLGDLNGDGRLDLFIGINRNYAGEYRTTVLTNTSSPGAISFGSGFQLQGGISPRSLITGDMNGDGLADLLSVSSNLRSMRIHRNALQYPPIITAISPDKAAPGASITLTGSGFSSTPANNIVYFGPVKAVVTAASANSLTVTVPFGATHSLISVLNTGTGMSGSSVSNFLPVFIPNKPALRTADIAASTAISTLFGVYTVTIADFDGDGKMDLLTNNSSSNVRIHPNTSSSGTISFGTATNLTTANLGARYMGIGDVDGDGKLDIAVPNLDSDNVSIFRNSGSGSISFDAKIDIAAADGPAACRFADFDGDGRPDLIVSNINTDKISIFPNTTTGGSVSFGQRIDFTVGAGPTHFSLNDFDGDGKLDIVVSLSNNTNIVVMRNIGSGSIDFAAPFALYMNFPSTVSSSDFDGDGKPDIIVTKINNMGQTVFRNTGTVGNLAFDGGVDFTPVGSAIAIDVADINGDGRSDVAVVDEGGQSLTLYPNSSSLGSVNFLLPITLSLPGTNLRDVVLADLDGDGRPDIASVDANNSTINIFRNDLVGTPTVQAADVSFSSLTSTSSTINWTSGSGSSCVVWMKAGSTGTPVPADETTYTANTAFGTGSQIGSTGWYAVYKGTGSSVSVTGLTAATDYRVMVTEYNGTAGLELYQTSAATNNPVQLTTLSTDATLSGLGLSIGTLSPAFATATLTYSATVPASTAAITVTPTARQANATLEARVNGGSYAAVASGAASAALALNGGSNTIDVKVTAQDGTTVKTYTITVIRRIEQVITFSSTASVAYGAADFDPGATSSNTGIAVTYVSSDPAIATIVAGKVHIIKAGTVNITASQAGDGTYVAAADKVQALTIQPKSITVSLNASPVITKIYDALTTATLAAGNYALSGIESGDVVSLSGTANFDTKDAGTNKTVTVNSFVLAGAQKDNYSLSTTSATTTGMITAKNITLGVNATPAITKVYDGSTAAALAAGNYTLTGIESGDVVTVSAIGSFDSKDAGSGKTVTVNTFVLAGAQKDNYSLSTRSAVSTGTITAKSITLSLNASPAITKTYDGSANAILTGGNYTLNGIEPGDEVTVSGTASFDSKDAGSGKTITVNSFVLAGAQKDNYSLSTSSAAITGTITAKSITLSLNASPAITKTYDGSANATLAAGNYTLNGVEAGDAVTVSGTAAFDTRNAGAGKIVTAANFALSGLQKDNYILSTTTASTSGAIEKKVLTVKADDQSKRQGEANPVFTLSYSGFINGEGTGDLSVLPTASSATGPASAPGTYPIIPGGGSAANYSFTYMEGSLTIGPEAFVNTAPTLDAIPDRAVCYTNTPQTIALSGITAGAGDGSQKTVLTVSSTNSALFNSLYITIGVSGTAVLTFVPANKAGGTARVSVTVSDDGGTANGGSDSFSRSFELTVGSVPVAVITSDAGTSVSKGSTVTLTASGGTSYTWATAAGIVSGQNTAVLTVRPLQNTTYTVTATSGPGCTSVQSIIINLVDDYKMVASNFLTPNGDGKNDTWVIKNIDAYPNNQVTVFDAAGRPVYKKNSYTNSQGWGGDVNGSPLTEGSYFYVIDFGDGEKVFKGFITILKDR